MNKISIWYRIGIVGSATWILGILAYSSRYSSFRSADFINAGVIPVVLLWGIGWIVNGIIMKRKATRGKVNGDEIEKSDTQNRVDESEKDSSKRRIKCPFCAELIQCDLTTCNYCGESF